MSNVLRTMRRSKARADKRRPKLNKFKAWFMLLTQYSFGRWLLKYVPGFMKFMSKGDMRCQLTAKE